MIEGFNHWCDYCGKRLQVRWFPEMHIGSDGRPWFEVHCPSCGTDGPISNAHTAEEAVEHHRELCRQRKEVEKGDRDE